MTTPSSILFILLFSYFFFFSSFFLTHVLKKTYALYNNLYLPVYPIIIIRTQKHHTKFARTMRQCLYIFRYFMRITYTRWPPTIISEFNPYYFSIERKSSGFAILTYKSAIRCIYTCTKNVVRIFSQIFN